MTENRHDRRKQGAFLRRGPRDWRMGAGKHAAGGSKFRFKHVNWHKRIIKEMKDSIRVITLVASGTLDWVFKQEKKS